MKLNEVQNNINNVREYILLLPINEQIYEINKILDYHVNYNHPKLQVKKKCSKINQIKDLKKSLIKYHLQQLKANLPLARNSVPLYKLLSFLDYLN